MLSVDRSDKPQPVSQPAALAPVQFDSTLQDPAVTRSLVVFSARVAFKRAAHRGVLLARASTWDADRAIRRRAPPAHGKPLKERHKIDPRNHSLAKSGQAQAYAASFWAFRRPKSTCPPPNICPTSPAEGLEFYHARTCSWRVAEREGEGLSDGVKKLFATIGSFILHLSHPPRFSSLACLLARRPTTLPRKTSDLVHPMPPHPWLRVAAARSPAPAWSRPRARRPEVRT